MLKTIVLCGLLAVGPQCCLNDGGGSNRVHQQVNQTEEPMSHPVPAPGALVLVGIGAGMVRWMRGRRKL